MKKRKGGLVLLLVLAGLLLLAGIYFLFIAPSIVIVPPQDVAVLVPVVATPVPAVSFVGVSHVSPLGLATGQVLSDNIIVTFTQAMDPTTINSNTFQVVGPGNTIIPGAYTSDATGKIWTFNPTINLLYRSSYNMTITTGVKSVSGESLPENFVWGFTTSNSPASSTGGVSSSGGSGGGSSAAAPITPAVISGSGRAPVILSNASNFTILAESLISTTGATNVTGDIGISPAAASFITGFALSLNSTYATSSLVNGKVYASDYSPPTPAYMTASISNMQTAYTDAAGRTIPDATELGAGNIDGMTIYPGLYKWGTGLLIPTGVTLDCQGNASAVFIFQIAQGLTVSNGATVTLAHGCQASNIFWQVAGQTTLGTTSVFYGTILDQTQIVINTGAVLHGKALAQSQVTLNANIVGP